MKKNISIFLVVIMMFASMTSVFAAQLSEDNTYTIKSVVSPTGDLSAGDAFTVSLYLTSSDGENIDLGEGLTYNFKAFIDTDVVACTNTSNTAKPVVNGFDALGAYGTDFKVVEDFIAINFGSAAGCTIESDTAIAVLNFTVNDSASAGTYTVLTALEAGYTLYDDASGVEVDQGDMVLDNANGKIAVTGGEEVFGIDTTKTGSTDISGDTMKDATNGNDVAATGDVVIAVFSKNVEDTELAAGTYGIIFGGVKYPGQKAVPGKTAWAIKLVGPEGKLKAGSYSYSVYAGTKEVPAANPWVID